MAVARPWHTPGMQIIRRELRSAGSAAAPRGRIWRLELRASVDLLIALGVMLVAVAMAVGYHVFRWRVAAGIAE
jgi:hypothetical protein